MIQFLETVIIAVVQGIGEFLPISSSAHIALTNKLFEVFGQPFASDADFRKLMVFLHVGTLLPILAVFRHTLGDMLFKDRTLLFKIIAATVPAVLVGLTVKKCCPGLEENFFLMGSGFILTGFLLIAASKSPDGEKTCVTLSWLDAMLIGCMQAVAVVPGISRFGSTVFAGLFRKLEWRESLKFSFLLSIPIVAGSGLLEIKDMFEEKGTGSLPAAYWAIGMTVSCACGLLTLPLVLRFLPKKTFGYFSLWVFLMSFLAFHFAFPPEAALPKKGDLQSSTQNVPLAPPSDSLASSAVENEKQKEQAKTDSAPPLTPEESLNQAIENTDNSELEEGKLEQEEAEREYQRILAEEEAREQALLEEEQKRVPFVDKPETLIPLDPKDKIWITPDGKSVVLLGRVSLREGLLELFACRVGSKEHESVVSIRVKPHLIHGALLAVNAEQGRPVQLTPEFVPPSGDEIEINVRWQDAEGKTQETLAQEWIWDAARSKENDKKPMTTHWVFTGSTQYKDEEGKVHYVAEETGELFGVSNFVGAILDVPIKSSADNDDLLFSCFTERIPPLGTPLTLILTPTKNKTR